MYQFKNAVYVLSPDRRVLVKVASGSGKRKNWKESTSYTDDRGRVWEFNTDTRRWRLHPDHKKPKGKHKAEFEQYLQDPGDRELKQVFDEIQDVSDRFDQSQDKIRSIVDDLKSTPDEVDDRVVLQSDRAFGVDLQAMNEILPFDLTSYRQTREVLSEIESELSLLTDLSAEARAEAAMRGFVETMRSVFDEVRDGVAEVQPILDKLDQERLDRLERTYEGRGRIDRDHARIAALQTRIFHTLNPRKLIRVPAGTTQAEYAAIVDRLVMGDKKAMKEYTVKKPAAKKRSSKRKR